METDYCKRNRLDLFTDKANIRLCYEAWYIGFSLCRFLRKSCIHCDIIAPSLIPVKTGTRVKTDRLDALKLAEFYAKELLTPINVPDETDEELRDVVRSHNFLVKHHKMLKTYILSTCKRYDIDFKVESGFKTHYWSTIPCGQPILLTF